METHPLTHAYWQSAAGELRDVRKLTFAALCMALCIALSALPSVPLWGGARITWGFLARSVCAWVCGSLIWKRSAFPLILRLKSRGQMAVTPFVS